MKYPSPVCRGCVKTWVKNGSECRQGVKSALEHLLIFNTSNMVDPSHHICSKRRNRYDLNAGRSFIRALCRCTVEMVSTALLWNEANLKHIGRNAINYVARS